MRRDSRLCTFATVGRRGGVSAHELDERREVERAEAAFAPAAHIAWALEAERKRAHPAGALYADSLGLALALHLLRSSAGPRRGLSAAQLKRVTGYIEDHIVRDLSLATLAAVAEISASHLKNAFRRSTGSAVHEYVVQRRVERAKRLLLQGKLPASEVALEAGFSHQSHMARCMRRVIGITPGALVRSNPAPRKRETA